MESIIKKAIEGGWDDTNYAFKLDVRKEPVPFDRVFEVGIWQYDEKITVDPLFWQALSRACGWKIGGQDTSSGWYCNACWFYHLNLTEGWDKAVSWLEELIK